MDESNLLKVVKTNAMLFEADNNIDYNITIYETRRKTNEASKIMKHHITNNHKSSNVLSDQTTLRQRYRKNKSTEFDMKSARQEVIKFGMSGFDLKDQKKMNIALTVKLGAKPPKSESKNYKELIKEKKQKKLEADNHLKFSQLGKNQIGAATTKCSSKYLKTPRRNLVGELSKNYGVVNININKKK